MEALFPALSVAIPDSSLIDSKSLLEKSLRVAQFARSLSIFRVEKVYVYKDISTASKQYDLKLLVLLLEYLDTPQYLRKLLYPKMKYLQFAGMLPPIQSPHHKKFVRTSEIQSGEARPGVLIKERGSWVVDVGLDRTIPFVGHTEISKKSIFKLILKKGQLVAEEIQGKVNDGNYWGYQVTIIPTLTDITRRFSNVKFLDTSRRGKPIGSVIPSITERFRHASEVVVIFGSPKNDAREIVSKNDEKIINSSLVINMFPFQGTKTVRLEEALLGSLALINNILATCHFGSS
jgi:methyltransferase